MAIDIRIASENDFKAVSEVVIRSLVPELVKEKLSDETITEILKKWNATELKEKFRKGTCFIASKVDDPIGVLGLKEGDERGILDTLSTFFVLPCFQGQAVGKALYLYVEKYALERGIKMLYVHSRSNAEGVYRKLGFIEESKIWKEHKDGKKSYTVVMEKNLECSRLVQ